jgi:hypothetical protein
MADDYAGRVAGQAQPSQPAQRRVYGYPVRPPYQSENEYFSKNRNVGGMAADDGAITLNPYSPLSAAELESVARNEAARLYMREQGSNFDFELTPQQKQMFAGTPYGAPGNESHAKASIIARALSGDPSAGELTPEQQAWVSRIAPQLRARQ